MRSEHSPGLRSHNGGNTVSYPLRRVTSNASEKPDPSLEMHMGKRKTSRHNLTAVQLSLLNIGFHIAFCPFQRLELGCCDRVDPNLHQLSRSSRI